MTLTKYMKKLTNLFTNKRTKAKTENLTKK